MILFPTVNKYCSQQVSRQLCAQAYPSLLNTHRSRTERRQDMQMFHFTWQWKALLAKGKAVIFSQIYETSLWSCFWPILPIVQLGNICLPKWVKRFMWPYACHSCFPLAKIIPIRVFLKKFSILLDLLVILQWLVSTVQQSESAICTHISPLFWISFPSGHHRALSK